MPELGWRYVNNGIGDELALLAELYPFHRGGSARGANLARRYHHVLATDTPNSHELLLGDVLVEFLNCWIWECTQA